MNIIWAVKDTEHDFRRLQDTGRVCCAFPNSMPPIDFSAQRRLFDEDVLTIADAENLILTVGPQVMVVNFTMMWLKEFGIAHLLVWDNSRGNYTCCPLRY